MTHLQDRTSLKLVGQKNAPLNTSLWHKQYLQVLHGHFHLLYTENLWNSTLCHWQDISLAEACIHLKVLSGHVLETTSWNKFFWGRGSGNNSSSLVRLSHKSACVLRYSKMTLHQFIISFVQWLMKWWMISFHQIYYSMPSW
jgi:hypothetical protein